MLTRAQVNGSFFTEAGMALAIDAALERMEVQTAPAQTLPPPPGIVPPALGPAKSAALARQ